MSRIKLTQVKSKIGSSENQRRNLIALGLRKINQTVEHDASPIIMGMVEKIRHMVTIEMIEGTGTTKKVATKKIVAPKSVDAVDTVATEAAPKKAAAPKKEAAPKKAAAPKKEAAPKAKAE